MKHQLRRVAFLSTCALIWVFSGAAECMQPGNDDDDSKPTGITLQQFTKKLCEKVESCNATHGRMFASAADCERTYNDMLSCPAQAYDADDGETCANTLAGVDCDTLFAGSPPPGCDALFEGPSVGSGQNCEEANCDNGLYCDYDVPDDTCAVCQPKGTTGQACSGYGKPCADGLYCDGNGECASQQAADASCGSDEECLSGFCQQGSCKEKLARDATCVSGDVCEGNLACISGACTDPPVGGESCADNSCAEMYTCTNNVCVAPDWCPSPAALGQDCSAHYACVDGTYCDYTDTICVAYLALADDCSDYTQSCDYSSAYCDYNATPPTCVAKLAIGQDCTDDYDCVSNYCGEDSKCSAAPVCTMP